MTTHITVFFKIIGHNVVEELYIFNSFQATPTHRAASLKTIKLSPEDQYTFFNLQTIQTLHIVSLKITSHMKVVEH